MFVPEPSHMPEKQNNVIKHEEINTNEAKQFSIIAATWYFENKVASKRTNEPARATRAAGEFVGGPLSSEARAPPGPNFFKV